MNAGRLSLRTVHKGSEGSGRSTWTISADGYAPDMTVIVTDRSNKTSATTRLGGGGGGDAAERAERSRCGEKDNALVRLA